jgi:hypothetical protein
MLHRHLNHQDLTPAAIDDVIRRGNREDWSRLRREVLSSPLVRDRVLRVCLPYRQDADAQRHQFWIAYVEARTT